MQVVPASSPGFECAAGSHPLRVAEKHPSGRACAEHLNRNLAGEGARPCEIAVLSADLGAVGELVTYEWQVYERRANIHLARK